MKVSVFVLKTISLAEILFAFFLTWDIIAFANGCCSLFCGSGMEVMLMGTLSIRRKKKKI